MSFEPFSKADFDAINALSNSSQPPDLMEKVEFLRREMAGFPEFELEFFRTRIRRFPTMRGHKGSVFGLPRCDNQHWYFFNVGGDQDQVQLNIGMFSGHIRVGLGFQIGRQVNVKLPAFQLFQTFLGLRPPLPFRDAFHQLVINNAFQIEIHGERDSATKPNDILHRLETFVVPAESRTFLLVGALWDPEQAQNKAIGDYRNVFDVLLPFYEELILAGGRYEFIPYCRSSSDL